MIACRWHAWLDLGRPEDLEPGLVNLLPIMLAKARRLLGHATDAEDAVQDAVVELLRTRGRRQRGLPLAAILHRLTTERALMKARSDGRRSRREQPLGTMEPATHAAPECEDLDMSRLNARQRAVISAFAAGGGAQAVATRLGISPGNAHVLLHRARTALTTDAQ